MLPCSQIEILPDEAMHGRVIEISSDRPITKLSLYLLSRLKLFARKQCNAVIIRLHEGWLIMLPDYPSSWVEVVIETTHQYKVTGYLYRYG